MTRDETVELYRKYKDIIDFVAEHGTSEVKKIALAIKFAVEMSEEGRG